MIPRMRVPNTKWLWAPCNRHELFSTFAKVCLIPSQSRPKGRHDRLVELFASSQKIKGAAMNMSLATKVRNVVAGHFGIEADRLADDARLQDDLGADWLDRLELMIVIEDQVPEIEINDEAI